MTEQQIEQLWQQAMKESIEAGEQFTRYRFAALVAAHAKAEERERCAKVCDKEKYSGYAPPEDGAAADYYNDASVSCAEAIRALKD